MKRVAHRRPGAGWVPYAVILVGPLLVWLVAQGPRWAAAVSTATAVSGVVAGLLERRIERRRIEKTAPIPSGLNRERLDDWRRWLQTAIAAARVEEGGQLDQMVRHGEAIDMHVRLFGADDQRPRLRVGARLVPWGDIRREWDESPGRLVILGEPGYGKTVAGLTLVAYINRDESVADTVAELFSLADWHIWNGEHPDGVFAGWLAEQLTTSYPTGLPLEIAQQLVDAGLVLPILDGLDEVPTLSQRRRCVDAINAYTRRTAPHRPFALTCRAVEYAELAPDWTRADHEVILAGLQPDQVEALLLERTVGRPGWETVRARHSDGDAALRELFRSPLRLGIALRTYSDRDPRELLQNSPGAARERLWELFISDAAGTFPGATSAQVRAWLEFFAVGLKRTARQRFMLHDLAILDPDPADSVRAFRRLLGTAVGIAVGLTGTVAGAVIIHTSFLVGPALLNCLMFGLATGLLLGLLYGARAGLVAGLTVGISNWLVAALTHGWLGLWGSGVDWLSAANGIVGGIVLGLFDGLVVGFAVGARSALAPRARVRVGWRVRVRQVMSGENLLVALTVALTAGLVTGALATGSWSELAPSGVTSGLYVGVLFGVMVWLVLGIADMASAGVKLVDVELPRRIAHGAPNAVLTATCVGSLTLGLVFGLVFAIPVGLSVMAGGEPLFALLSLVAVTVISGLVSAVVFGLDAWLYHHWLRRRLARRGLIPSHLPAFLAWCAEPARGWMRATTAYEFRHRELLDYLAPVPARISGSSGKLVEGPHVTTS